MQEIMNQKHQEFNVQGSLLRDETGGRTIVVVGTRHKPRVKLDLVVMEVKVRSAGETTNRNRIVELVTNKINPEIVIVLEAIWMRKKHITSSK